MIYSLVTFILLIAVLSALRTKLVYELSGASLLLFGSTRPGLVFYSLLFLPGTIIHELSHWVVAEILQVRTGQITIFPDLSDGTEDGSRQLGSVHTSRSDPFRGFFIGIAPFVSGLAILAVLGRLLALGFDIGYLWWQLALIIYSIMVIGNSMMISDSDRRTWPFIIIFIVFIVFFISKYYPALFQGKENLVISMFEPVNKVLGVTAGLNLVMIGVSYGMRRLIEKMTKKRIIHK